MAQLATNNQINYIKALLEKKGFDSVSAAMEQIISDLQKSIQSKGELTMTEASTVINFLKMKEDVTAQKSGVESTNSQVDDIPW